MSSFDFHEEVGNGNVRERTALGLSRVYDFSKNGGVEMMESEPSSKMTPIPMACNVV